jgi:hypothetical protein
MEPPEKFPAQFPEKPPRLAEFMPELPEKLLPDVLPVCPKPPLKEVPLKDDPVKDDPVKLEPVKFPAPLEPVNPEKPPPKDVPVDDETGEATWAGAAVTQANATATKTGANNGPVRRFRVYSISAPPRVRNQKSGFKIPPCNPYRSAPVPELASQAASISIIYPG